MVVVEAVKPVVVQAELNNLVIAEAYFNNLVVAEVHDDVLLVEAGLYMIVEVESNNLFRIEI